MTTADYWIHHLNLLPHPEGGFYRETYRAEEVIPSQSLPHRFGAIRNFSTAIYFLLRRGERSLFHRIKSDELWHFHKGSALSIFILTSDGLTTRVLGDNPEQGESLQVVIPANSWFGARVNDNGDFTLASCTVSPGFDFADFEIADRFILEQQFPAQSEVIHILTK